MTKKQKKMLLRILITAVMLAVLHVLPITGVPQLIAYLAAYLVIGYDILKKAGRGILNGRAFDENFLMALATLGAFFLAVWTKSGDYVEGISVMLFYQIGELFQSYAVGKSRKNISALMDMKDQNLFPYLENMNVCVGPCTEDMLPADANADNTVCIGICCKKLADAKGFRWVVGCPPGNADVVKGILGDRLEYGVRYN